MDRNHILRMDDNIKLNRIFKYKPKGKRAVGRRMKRIWADCLDDDLKTSGKTRRKTDIDTQRNRGTAEA